MTGGRVIDPETGLDAVRDAYGLSDDAIRYRVRDVVTTALELEGGSTIALAPYARDRFVVTEGPLPGARAEIIRKADGSIGWLYFAGRIHARTR